MSLRKLIDDFTGDFIKTYRTDIGKIAYDSINEGDKKDDASYVSKFICNNNGNFITDTSKCFCDMGIYGEFCEDFVIDINKKLFVAYQVIFGIMFAILAIYSWAKFVRKFITYAKKSIRCYMLIFTPRFLFVLNVVVITTARLFYIIIDPWKQRDIITHTHDTMVYYMIISAVISSYLQVLIVWVGLDSVYQRGEETMGLNCFDCLYSKLKIILVLSSILLYPAQLVLTYYLSHRSFTKTKIFILIIVCAGLFLILLVPLLYYVIAMYCRVRGKRKTDTQENEIEDKDSRNNSRLNTSNQGKEGRMDYASNDQGLRLATGSNKNSSYKNEEDDYKMENEENVMEFLNDILEQENGKELLEDCAFPNKSAEENLKNKKMESIKEENEEEENSKNFSEEDQQLLKKKSKIISEKNSIIPLNSMDKVDQEIYIQNEEFLLCLDKDNLMPQNEKAERERDLSKHLKYSMTNSRTIKSKETEDKDKEECIYSGPEDEKEISTIKGIFTTMFLFFIFTFVDVALTLFISSGECENKEGSIFCLIFTSLLEFCWIMMLIKLFVNKLNDKAYENLIKIGNLNNFLNPSGNIFDKNVMHFDEFTDSSIFQRFKSFILSEKDLDDYIKRQPK
ncbi:MAG: hypothetical protein MJ252_26065 [archaeon]|nr:hypothetical protein [archaeon]